MKISPTAKLFLLDPTAKRDLGYRHHMNVSSAMLNIALYGFFDFFYFCSID